MYVLKPVCARYGYVDLVLHLFIYPNCDYLYMHEPKPRTM